MSAHTPDSRFEKKLLVDAHAELDLGVRYRKDPEAYAMDLEWEAKDLEVFLHDHRSRDAYHVSIERTYETRCMFCGHSEDWKGEEPNCCESAIEAFNNAGKVRKLDD